MGDVVEAPVRGNDGLFFTLKNGAATAVEYDGHVKKIEFTSEDKDDLTFAEVQAGDVKVTGLKITGVTSLKAGSLYRLLWDNPAGLFDAVIGFYGNAVPTASKPHFTGPVKANGRPTPASEARTGRNREEFEYELTFDEAPELDEGI